MVLLGSSGKSHGGAECSWDPPGRGASKLASTLLLPALTGHDKCKHVDGPAGPSSGRLGQRHVLCLVMFVGTFFQYLQRSVMNSAVVGADSMAAELGWSNAGKGLVLSGFFYGYSLGQIPAGWFSSRFGGRPVFFILGLATCLNMAVPRVAAGGAGLVAALRVAVGLAQSPMWPNAMGLLSQWTVPSERSRLLAWSGSSMPLAYFTGIFLTTFLMHAIGWRAVFFGYGVVALLWVPLWHRFGWSMPEEHPRISEEERRFILSSRLDASPPAASALPRSVPWAAIFSQKAVWAVLVADSILGAFANAVFFGFVPTYMHYQLGLSIHSTGFWGAAPQLGYFFLTMTVAPLADELIRRGTDLTHVRKLFSVVPAFIAALCSLLLAFLTSTIGPSHSHGDGSKGGHGVSDSAAVVAAILLVSLVTAVQGAAISGSTASIMDMTKEYTPVVAGVSNSCWALLSGLASTFVGFLLDHGNCPQGNTMSSHGSSLADAMDSETCTQAWCTAFGCAGFLFLAQGVVFGLFGSSQPLHLPAAVDQENNKEPSTLPAPFDGICCE
mmetsp:Transcript_13549/g.34235  ORF Transcript_13549/g.34235 Transcript_13549/m.34235 type:complete len:554 (-) Transcript_13549:441-2102(-)